MRSVHLLQQLIEEPRATKDLSRRPLLVARLTRLAYEPGPLHTIVDSRCCSAPELAGSGAFERKAS